MCPDLVLEYFEKPCFIEVDGKWTKGMLIIDWVMDWVAENQEHKQNTSIIISELNLKAVVDLLIESVKPKIQE